ncbi:MAG: LPS export ABC transporter periplasmic protein LptC [Bacteroidales bacterium]
MCFLFFIFNSNFFLTSCVNKSDIEKVKAYNSIVDSLPTEIIYNFELKYSEEGNILFELNSPKAVNWGVQGLLIFPEGFEVTFFDKENNQKSYLRANYGENIERKKFMVAKGDVVITNFITKETLNTEEMNWDQNKKLIYTDKFVKITTEDDVIYGDGGFESDEEFNEWTIKNPYGDIYINDDE